MINCDVSQYFDLKHNTASEGIFMLNECQMEAVVALRRQLHACPERSGQEARTMAIIRQFLAENTSLTVRDMGGWLLATHWEGDGMPGMCFRADMDAIPVEGADCDARRAGEGHFGAP